MALTDAERSRLRRERRRRGLVVVEITIHQNRVSAALMDGGLLSPDSDDLAELAAAIETLVDEFAKIDTRDARRRASRGIFAE